MVVMVEILCELFTIIIMHFNGTVNLDFKHPSPYLYRPTETWSAYTSTHMGHWTGLNGVWLKKIISSDLTCKWVSLALINIRLGSQDDKAFKLNLSGFEATIFVGTVINTVITDALKTNGHNPSAFPELTMQHNRSTIHGKGFQLLVLHQI